MPGHSPSIPLASVMRFRFSSSPGPYPGLPELTRAATRYLRT